MPIDEEMDDPNADEELLPPDVRRPRTMLDSRRQADGELSDSDDEGEGERRDHASHRELGDSKTAFRMGVENLAAGPSGHTTVARVLSQMEDLEDEKSLTPQPEPDNSKSREGSSSDMDIED